MKKFMKFGALTIVLLFIASCGGGGGGGGVTPPPDPEPIPLPVPTNPPSLQNVLILYDTAGTYGEQGKINALLLENLLGHFSITITSKPADQYIDNEIVDQNISTVFYLGTTYDALGYYASGSNEHNSYTNFFQDIAEDNKTVVWINYNLDLLETEWETNNWGATTFEQTTGFTYFGAETTIKYNRVMYKNTALYKGLIPFATPGADTSTCEPEPTINNAYACATELNIIGITDGTKASTLATAYTTLDTVPHTESYVTHGGNFWFVGDIPFSYMSEEDRYLAFSDLLHDMLGIPHQELHRAIMRLEDVNAMTDPSDLTVIADYMRNQNIPFSVATIPQYEDPLGTYYAPGTSIAISESTIGTQLRGYYYERLIDIIQHGYTHQYDSIENPYNGVTADDFEFMIVTDLDNDGIYLYEGPTENDNGDWARNRILEGNITLAEVDLQAFAWEAPHYMAGPNHYRAIKEVYPIQYSRLIYYPQESTDKSKFIGQFFPYVIRKDTYGYYIIPENIHNISDQPNPGYRVITAEDIIHFAHVLKVVRDGVASFYYHPYLRTGDLSVIIPGLQNEGYTFVRATTLVE